MPLLETTPDAELVAACLGGNRNAFAHIVERYQRLLCSLAYSATGSVAESEDAAQDAFVTAWQQLGELREPEKLRSWLCGILRFKVSHRRRRDGREPVRRAEGIESAAELPAVEEPAMNLAMQKEEQAILWSELERVPELYREALVLYYREHRSVEHVAVALDLTEDAVKQRLARGRKILQERVLAFVEGALARSTPGRVFTLGVLAALPEIAAPAKAAAVGVTAAAHGGMLAKSTSLATLAASFGGVANTLLQLRASLDQSRTPRERRAVVKVTIACFFGTLAFLGVLCGLRGAAFRWWEQRAIFAVSCQALVVAFIVAWPPITGRMLRFFRVLRSAERLRHPECFADPRDQIGSSAGEYRSRAALFGVPLVHIRFAAPDEGQRPVFGWIAAGDRARGLLFAWGGTAIAPISIGLISVGVFSLGALSFGLIGLGTCAVGWFSVGCFSVGVEASAWLSALGWETAQSGGFALAHLAARAPVAFAQHANDPVAHQIFTHPDEQRNTMTLVTVMAIMSFLPIAYYARAVRQRLGRKSPAIARPPDVR